MYLREVVSPRKRGPDARYLQLVEGERDTQGRVQTCAHVHVCVLAYLLVRVAENRAQLGWERIREQVEKISLTALATDRASVLQTKALTRAERDLLNSCKAAPPPQILQVTAR